MAKLSERRMLHKLYHKTENGLAPDYLAELIPPRIQETHASSRFSFDSFLLSMIREWNELPNEIKAAPSLLSF